MLLEITGICHHCAESVVVLMHDGNPLDECTACQQAPFTARIIQGLIYVVKNPHQTGVKIGLTRKSIEHRIKSLNSTGVPGEFVAIAIFQSDKPEADERRVHEKLRRHNIAKEHFDLDPIEAVLGAYRALNKRRAIFFNPEHEEIFNLKLDEARIKMELKLRGERA